MGGADDSGARGMGILVVEDDPDLAAAFAGVLGATGLPVRSAGDGAQALAAIAAGAPALLVLDVCLPRGNGLEVLRRVRVDEASRGGPAVPVLLVSGFYDHFEPIADLFGGLGVGEFLPKPVAPAALLEAARRSLARIGAPPPASGATGDAPRPEPAPEPGPARPPPSPGDLVARVKRAADHAIAAGPGDIAAATALWEAVLAVPDGAVWHSLGPFFDVPCAPTARYLDWAAAFPLPADLQGVEALLGQVPRLDSALSHLPPEIVPGASRLAWALLAVRALAPARGRG